ncbi:MAG: hypothetical protein OXO56_14225 [Gammaproteobacteria bacterium]|nr:hypothetical protein [Gammaproteobacteria bacterium]
MKKMTEAQYQIVVDWLRKHTVEGVRCPTCSTGEWAIADGMGFVPGPPDTDKAFPAAVVICKTCFRMTLYNTVNIPGFKEAGVVVGEAQGVG